MRISDRISDVCSSDLARLDKACDTEARTWTRRRFVRYGTIVARGPALSARCDPRELIFSGIRDLLLAPALFRLAGRLSWRSARSCARIVQTLRWSPARPTRLWRSPSALAASCIRADAKSPANLRAVL